jgi:DNA invertase Pin-like site-specific DNA recombinase
MTWMTNSAPTGRSGGIAESTAALQEQIDTATSGGKLVFHIFGALAKFERDLIRERRRQVRQQPEHGAELGAGQL